MRALASIQLSKQLWTATPSLMVAATAKIEPSRLPQTLARAVVSSCSYPPTFLTAVKHLDGSERRVRARFTGLSLVGKEGA